VLLEVEAELLAEPELQQVVVQGLLGDPNFLCRVFEGVPEQVAFVVVHTVVELPPETHFLNDLLDGSLFGPLLLVAL
jgi:hypothetical protein